MVRGSFLFVASAHAEGHSNSQRSLAAVLMVDARETGKDLAKGISTAVQQWQSEPLKKSFWDAFRAVASNAGGAVGSAAATGLVGAAVDPVTAAATARVAAASVVGSVQSMMGEWVHGQGSSALLAWVLVCEAAGKHPCLKVDEANMVFDGGDAEETLQLMVKLTKEGRLTVLFASSEYAFPYRLERIKFSLSNLSAVVFAGEVAPAHMRQLLQNEWGMGEHLAESCLAWIGGHIYQTAKAVRKLAQDGPGKEDCTAKSFAPFGSAMAVERCISEEEKHPGVVSMLFHLAQNGFVGLPLVTDPLAEVLAQHNVAGFVSKDSLVVGLDPVSWGAFEAGLVPSSHQMRLVIASTLERVVPGNVCLHSQLIDCFWGLQNFRRSCLSPFPSSLTTPSCRSPRLVGTSVTTHH